MEDRSHFKISTENGIDTSLNVTFVIWILELVISLNFELCHLTFSLDPLTPMPL